MKLFLDVASKYLMNKCEFYKKRANIVLILSLAFWLLTISSGYAIWYYRKVQSIYIILALLFMSILTSFITKDLYTKSRVYGCIYEDLEEIRRLANEEVKNTPAGA